MKEGDYCLIEFTFMKRKFSGYFKGYGTVKEIGNGYFLFIDNEGYEYRTQPNRVKFFELRENPVRRTMAQKITDFLKHIFPYLVQRAKVIKFKAEPTPAITEM